MRPRQPRTSHGRGPEGHARRSTPQPPSEAHDRETGGARGSAERRAMAAVMAALAPGVPDEVTGYDETARRSGRGPGRRPD